MKTLNSLKKQIVYDGHRLTACEQTFNNSEGQTLQQFNLYGSTGYPSKLDINTLEGQFMVSLSIKGWLQSVHICDSVDEIYQWFNDTVLSYEIG